MEPQNDIVVFYDIPSTLSPMAWSPHTWKTRLALNYKGIPYRTVWIEYPDIEPVMKRWEAPPAMPPNYTLPVISIPDPDSSRPRFIGESFEIALELDRLYPERPLLFPPGSHALQAMFKTISFNYLNTGLRDLVVPQVPNHLREGSVEYFIRTREKKFGSLNEWCPVGSEKRELEWTKLKGSLDTIDAALKRGPGGKWVMGDEFSFADISLGSELIWLKRIGSKEDWERISHWHGGRWGTLVDNLAPYMAEDT